MRLLPWLFLAAFIFCLTYSPKQNPSVAHATAPAVPFIQIRLHSGNKKSASHGWLATFLLAVNLCISSTSRAPLLKKTPAALKGPKTRPGALFVTAQIWHPGPWSGQMNMGNFVRRAF